jgi:hypothetical protein
VTVDPTKYAPASESSIVLLSTGALPHQPSIHQLKNEHFVGTYWDVRGDQERSRSQGTLIDRTNEQIDNDDVG